MPAALTAPNMVVYSADDLKTDVEAYRAALNLPDLGKARGLRDRIVYRIMAQIDLGYGRFENSVMTARAGYMTGVDATQLGISAASAVIGATEIKDILNATTLARQGTRLSVYKNFFEQKTSEALISQMRATRKTKATEMLKSMNDRDVLQYPLESAWTDLSAYYYAGTIPSALVDIAGKAGSDAVVAEVKLQTQVLRMSVQAGMAVDVRTEYEVLRRQFASTDRKMVANGVETLKAILGGAQVKFDDAAKPEALLGALKQAMADADADDSGAKLKALNDAVAKANKTN
jgi:hypothetical protein